MDPLDRAAHELADLWDWEYAKQLHELENQFLSNSHPYFTEVLDDLVEANQASLRSFHFRIRQEQNQLHALAYPKRHLIRRKHFDINISQGLYNFFFRYRGFIISLDY
jgi:hypothetical protein